MGLLKFSLASDRSFQRGTSTGRVSERWRLRLNGRSRSEATSSCWPTGINGVARRRDESYVLVLGVVVRASDGVVRVPAESAVRAGVRSVVDGAVTGVAVTGGAAVVGGGFGLILH